MNPAPTDPVMCSAAGSGLTAGVIDTEGEVKIFARDTFGNALETTDEADKFRLEVMTCSSGDGLAACVESDPSVVVIDATAIVLAPGTYLVRRPPPRRSVL